MPFTAGTTAGPAHQVAWEQVTAFRLHKQHLTKRLPPGALTSAALDIGGAQAQLLPAAQTSIRARVGGVTLSDLDTAVWKKRTLAKAWCMRRTMFLVPSTDLAMFVRGSALRAEREIRWVMGRGVKLEKIEKLVAAVLDALDEPLTQSEMAVEVSRSAGYRVRYKAGGVGWGNKKNVPWVDFGPLALPANYLLHLAGARGVYCSGPNRGSESTFVRADRWVPHWKDMAEPRAQSELLKTYLRAHGPSTLSDFAIWTGMTARDAKKIWTLGEPDMVRVDVEGWSASLLRDELPALTNAWLESPTVRLLPFFDSFMLGHKSHRAIVGQAEHKLVYREAGWVSPVLLVDGKAAGVWSHRKKGELLQVDVSPFARISPHIRSMVREEADELGQFLGCSDIKTRML